MAAAVRILLKEGELPALLDDSHTALAIEEALPRGARRSTSQYLCMWRKRPTRDRT